MNTKMYDVIKLAQMNNKEAMQSLIDKFMPIISKYQYKLGYAEARTDLIIEFIQVIDKIDLCKFDSEKEGTLVVYINKALISRRINLLKKYIINGKQSSEICIDIIPDRGVKDNKFDNFLVKEILSKEIITDKQRVILINRYLRDKSDAEIACNLKISRQAVCENRTRAISKIRKYLNAV